MKKILVLSMLLMSTSSWAQWSPVAVDTDATVFNFDFSTLRKEGELRKIWTLTNLLEKDANGVLSGRMRMEYDCKSERHRVLSFRMFSELFANGIVLKEGNTPTPWSDIAPDTAAWKLMQTACKAKLP
jgi:hypothetical protein